MNVVSRGVRNAFRNSIRTFSIVVILGLSIGLSLAMLVARASVEDKITEVKTSIGNVITITPAGAQGFQGGGEPLTAAQMDKVKAVANVTKVTAKLEDRLTTDTSNLQSAIEPGTLGNRAAGNNGVRFEIHSDGPGSMKAPDAGDQVKRIFTPPILVTGVNDLSDAKIYGGDTVSYTSGKAFDASKDEDVAVVGKALAEKNSLKVGSTFTAYGKTVTVVGIYDVGNTFANGNVLMQLSALQRLSAQTGSITSASAQVNSYDNMPAAVKAVETALGSAADVVSSQDEAKAAIEPLESVKKISTFSVLGAVGAGAIIILLTMVMIVRERRREIGVFKAIGASNLKVMYQFMAEAVTLTILGLLAGLIIGAVAAAPVTNMLVKNSSTSETNIPTSGPSNTIRVSGGGPRGAVSFKNFGNNAVANAKNVKASVGVGILGYGVATALAIAILGSAIPTFLISKIRPAEVMRAE